MSIDRRQLDAIGRPIIVASHQRSGTHLTIDLLRRHFPDTNPRLRPLETLHHLYIDMDSFNPGHHNPMTVETALRLGVYVGKTRVARVETNWAMESGLREGDEWTQELADRIYDAAKLHAAYQHALHLMSARQRSAFKLVQKLRQSGHEAHDARAAAERLAALGLIDDEALAERLAQDLARSGKLGQRGIENKLRAKGIEADLAKKSAQSASCELGSPDAALTLAHKRAARLVSLDPKVARRRLYGFLVRRGFDHDEATRATEAALTATSDEALQ